MNKALPALYRVSVWDHDANRFVAYVTRCRLWRLRKVLGTLRRYGYSRCSWLVERVRDGGRAFSGRRD